ncbi:MAG TPA: alanine--tRNA ligase [Candidatus Eremiobacteraceae bacterium]|nr:alanine--tRNA ligase [Candidatus Eremiobacteraceae bacterium]
MTSAELRRSFVDFFVGKGHKQLPGASLIPDAMSTTLFTIAGMEPFVPVFLGEEPAPSPRVVTVQRCLRVAGGKNDIENVGRSGRHGTFLEMLGNFSFGDYYKREAIAFAWEYLTKTLALPVERLYATVYVDDDEAAEIWRRDIGLAPERISRLREDNFWDMGPTGPCGPCSEIFYDLGPQVGCGKPTCGVGCPDCDRYIEFWNLVFQQYDRDSSGTLHPLPKKCIDTGLGFERTCMIIAGKTSIFDTDLYQDIIVSLPAGGASAVAESERAVHRRIVADHARAVVNLIADGVTPSNTDRGYVLRFLIRRAVRSGKVLGYPNAFLAGVVPAVVKSLASGYPEIAAAATEIAAKVRLEETLFEATIQRGQAILAEKIEQLKGSHTAVPGSVVFLLHDTYGFPPELTAEIASEAGLQTDMAGYRDEMRAQRERARRDAMSKRAEVRVDAGASGDVAPSVFVGYETLEAQAAVLWLGDARGAAVDSLDAGVEGLVVLDRTPFYAERGGQMGDRGVLATSGATFDVQDARYEDKSHRRVVHVGKVRAGSLKTGDRVDAIVDPVWRREIRRHHSVTHLLQRALKDVAGEGVAQRGSAVFADRTRFDFDSPVGQLAKEQRAEVSSRVNDLIRSDYHVEVEEMPFAEAVTRGVVYMKGERYGDIVRVVRFGPSVELCGGTHVGSTGEIGHFILLSESAIGAGIRRVEGLASESADAYDARIRDAAEEAGSVLTATIEQLPEAVARLARERRDLEKKLAALQSQITAGRASEYIAGAKDADGVGYIALRTLGDEGVDGRELANSIRSKWPSGVIVIASANDGKVSLVVSSSDDVAGKGATAKSIFAALAPHIDGKGGGNATLAQGGGRNADGIDAALDSVPAAISKALRG